MQSIIAKTVYKVSDFLSWQRNNSLVLSPSFQRRSVWPAAAKSFFIDTVVRGLPIPIIFLREQIDLKTLEPIREVVDGQQRLRTLISFIEPQLLKDFDLDRDSFVVKKTHNPDISGKTFSHLLPSIRRKILNYDFSVHVLSSDTDDREVLQIFARMNATGIKLNAQELRNADYYGIFKDFAYDLGYEHLNHWRTWKIFSENDIARMAEVEETSDLMLLMLDGLHGKNQGVLDKTYAKYEEDFPEATELARRFRTVMDKIDQTFGSRIQSSAFSRKTFFHTLFTFYYDLLFGLNTPLERKKPKDLPSTIVAALEETSDQILHGPLDERLAKVLRGATADYGSRKLRLELLQENLARASA
jgi:hypothetical protein